LVTLVTPAVKSVALRTMLLAVPSTPRTTVAAKAAPGKVGKVGVEELEPADGVPADLAEREPALAVACAQGRWYPHHMGT
jgi:hypothetical protein